MRPVTRLSLVASLLFLPAHGLLAQPAVDPSGHWAGAVHVPAFDRNPATDVDIEIDLARSADGVLAGTFGQPSKRVRGLPLSGVSVDGSSVIFEIKVSDGGAFHATLADPKTMTGTFVTAQGGHSIPFDLTRAGDAQIAPAPKSAPITKELEGTWNGELEVDGKTIRLVLKLANRPDGTATGTILSADGGGLEIPVALTQTASGVTIDVTSVGASYAGVLRAGEELVGSWTEQSVTLPLTFKRAAP
jgi:hypothetical protein